MRFLTVEQMRAADRAAVGADGISTRVLMCRAGAAVARAVERAAALRGGRDVVVVAGHGNNGGDACVAARCLFEDGFRVRTILACAPEQLKGAAGEVWSDMCARGVPHRVLATRESWDEPLDVASETLLRRGILVDGVLGTGCRGAPTGAAERAIRWINRMRPHGLVVSIDLPSGLNGDTGEADGARVRADITVTFARPKRCFLNGANSEWVGHLEVADIGIPDAVCDQGATDAECQLIAAPEIARGLGARGWSSHKGDYGHLCVIGGSPGLCHAPVMAALGAVGSGVGLLTLAVPAESGAAAAAHVPEAMMAVLRAPQGALSAEALDGWGRDINDFDAVVAGPGMTQSELARGAVARLLATYRGRLVLDADGLNALAALKAKGWQPLEGQRRILTPHPGEAARLLGVSVQEVQRDRLAAVRALADLYRSVAVLKGAGTLVCEPGGVPWLNLTGNPGMASGGTGDVLAGVVGGLWAQGMRAREAAATAVWAHGAAGDFAAWAGGQTSLSATSLAARLGAVFQTVERKPLAG